MYIGTRCPTEFVSFILWSYKLTRWPVQWHDAWPKPDTETCNGMILGLNPTLTRLLPRTHSAGSHASIALRTSVSAGGYSVLNGGTDDTSYLQCWAGTGE